MKRRKYFNEVIKGHIDHFNKKHNTNLSAEIKKVEDNFVIQISEKMYSPHFFQTAPSIVKILSPKQFFELKNTDIKSLTTELIHEAIADKPVGEEFPPYPFPGLYK